MNTKPMLAVEADFTKIQYPVYASPKLDGIRCLIVGGVPKSRTLKDIPNLKVQQVLSSMALDGLDGELVVGNPRSPTVFRDTTSFVMSHDKTDDFLFFVFDLHDSSKGYPERLGAVKKMVTAYQRQHQNIALHDHALIESERSLLNYEAVCVEQGYEGIIVRANLTAPYKYGRSTVNEGSLLKVKRFEDSEAEIIGFEEEMFNGNDAQTNELGRTKRSTAKAGLSGKQTLGAFKVRDCVSGIEFSIGTGLTAAERAQYWAGRDGLVGGLVKYKFFPVGVKVAPRHPVFLGFRDKADL
jgi:DNA ligase-1